MKKLLIVLVLVCGSWGSLRAHSIRLCVVPDSLSVPPEFPDTITAPSINNSIQSDSSSPYSMSISSDTIARRSSFRKWVEQTIVVVDNKEQQRINQQLENDYIQRFKGAAIRNIHIFRNNVFDQAKVWAERKGNQIHRVTRERQIRNDLLFKDGDLLDPDVILNNQQLIRSRPYISDVKILVEPVAEDSTQVDIFVLTRDTWTISANASVSGNGKSFLELYDKNFVGYGNMLRIRTYVNWKTGLYGGNQVEYSLPNILGSFLSGRAVLGKGFDEVLYGAEINKDFIRPKDYAVGASLFYEQEDVKLRPVDTTVVSAHLQYDLWAGKSVQLNGLSRSSLYYSGRFFDRSYRKRPDVMAEQNPYFHNEKLALFSVGLYRERFHPASLIYGYGVTEYIARGYRASFMGGYSWGEFGNRYYLGGEATAGHFTRYGYIMWRFGMGSYLNELDHRFHRTTLSSGIDYFSNLITLGRYQVRQFVSLSLLKGWNRQEGFQEVIGFTKNNGLRGLEEKVYGLNRLIMSSETVIFTPWQLYQFRFALFCFLDAGLLGDDGNMLKNPFYSTVGVGVRIKNEKLIFQTINIRLGIALNRNGFTDAEYFRISSENRMNPNRFIPRRPEIIPYK